MKIVPLLLTFLFAVHVHAADFPFRHFFPTTTSPSEEIHCLYFDHDGLMWIGTNDGAKSFDGYQVNTYKSNAYHPDILPNNTVLSITEDQAHGLWFGTRDGLVRADKRTGSLRTFHLPDRDQRTIYMLHTTSDGTVWVGTDGGLSYYEPAKGTFYTYDASNSYVIEPDGRKVRMTGYSVKSILEMDNGDLLIGTWCSGLMRLKRGSNVFRRYPKLNDLNSAYSLYLDKQRRLWVGTWGHGVVRIDNPDNVAQPQVRRYPYAINNFDTFYQFIEDPMTQRLWACTREGICLMDTRDPAAQWTRYTRIGGKDMDFCCSIATDHEGNIWVATQNQGIVQISTAPSPVNIWNLGLGKDKLTVNYICAIHTDDGNRFWMGLNPYGIALYDRTTGQTRCNQEIPGFEHLPSNVTTTSISSIIRRRSGDLWMASNNYGIVVRPHGQGTPYVHNTQNTPWVIDDFVNTLFESGEGTLWVGQRRGLSIVTSSGKGTTVSMKEGQRDFSRCDIHGITEDRRGNIWLATNNEGIIRVTGNPGNLRSLRFHQYSPANHNFAMDEAAMCLEDSHGRLWAASNSGGLFLYNAQSDSFEPMNEVYHLQGDRCLSINEDSRGSLWVTTNTSLARLQWPGDQTQVPDITYYTKEDGVDGFFLTTNANCRWGDGIYFGGRNSILAFTPDAASRKTRKPLRLLITDVLIDGNRFLLLDSAVRRKISDELPISTRQIRIPAGVEKFSVVFALLTYGDVEKNTYAYRLEGYDRDWHYCTGTDHQATFQNLPSGHYTLLLRATDNQGTWIDLPYELHIRVLPPWYLSWWAYLIYILLLAAGILGSVRWYKNYLKTKNRLHTGILLANITHELLTPLTVISASIYKLRKEAPQHADDYDLMENNVTRSTRLLRQILEVRKSQAGQLRLLVSKGDLAGFVRKACENIRPMTLTKDIELQTHLPEGECPVWFDPDKLDKILYNLLSNAIKYNKEHGKVVVSLSMGKGTAIITVADTGIGMSQLTLRNLYTRFLDGDYRKAGVTGTGIGMSLMHDLVKLHHGEVVCQSTEGEGTTFTITLPTGMNAYAREERQDETLVKLRSEDQHRALPADHPVNADGKHEHTLLLVEDNAELLSLMKGLLAEYYNVYTARNGQQALAVIAKRELDVVVTDWMMPVMDGVELTRSIKSSGDYAQLPVIMLTAKTGDDDKSQGYESGADAYMAKPFRLNDLLLRVNSIIANRERVKRSFSRQADYTVEEQHYSSPDTLFMQKAVDCVKAHLADSDYGRDQFTQDMCVSASTLYNKLRAITGQNITGFINSIRLKEACRMARQQPDITISELSQRVGFNTPQYFSKLFKKEFGSTLKDYLASTDDETKA